MRRLKQGCVCVCLLYLSLSLSLGGRRGTALHHFRLLHLFAADDQTHSCEHGRTFSLLKTEVGRRSSPVACAGTPRRFGSRATDNCGRPPLIRGDCGRSGLCPAVHVCCADCVMHCAHHARPLTLVDLRGRRRRFVLVLLLLVLLVLVLLLLVLLLLVLLLVFVLLVLLLERPTTLP